MFNISKRYKNELPLQKLKEIYEVPQQKIINYCVNKYTYENKHDQ